MYKTQNEILSQCKKTFNIERDMKQPEKCCCLDQKPNNLLERERDIGTKQGGNEEAKSCF